MPSSKATRRRPAAAKGVRTASDNIRHINSVQNSARDAQGTAFHLIFCGSGGVVAGSRKLGDYPMRKIVILAGLLAGAALFATGTPAKAWVGCAVR